MKRRRLRCVNINLSSSDKFGGLGNGADPPGEDRLQGGGQLRPGRKALRGRRDNWAAGSTPAQPPMTAPGCGWRARRMPVMAARTPLLPCFEERNPREARPDLRRLDRAFERPLRRPVARGYGDRQRRDRAGGRTGPEGCQDSAAASYPKQRTGPREPGTLAFAAGRRGWRRRCCGGSFRCSRRFW